MAILEVVDQVRDLLRTKGRVTYRILKRQFALDDEVLEDVKAELIDAERVAVDEEGKVLVWVGEEGAIAVPDRPSVSQPGARTSPQAERRQLTVMFCDLVGSTALSEQLDPEELQTVVRTYQEVSAQVIERYEGHIAQYLGDGLLVYFGYPTAHEDDAARAICAGLEVVTALHQAHGQFPQPIQVRIGIHTGPVVVGQMGGGSCHEQLALGETPNIAARVQGQAQPDEVVVSAATQRLVAGLFEMEDYGRHDLKSISTSQSLYRVTAESPAQSRFEAAVRSGMTPLVGREDELQFLYQRWTQAQAANGQAVLVSGEPGIGKSRLVQELKAQVTQEGATQIEFRCSPYHQNSALYPLTEHLQRLLQFASDDTPETKLAMRANGCSSATLRLMRRSVFNVGGSCGIAKVAMRYTIRLVSSSPNTAHFSSLAVCRKTQKSCYEPALRSARAAHHRASAAVWPSRRYYRSSCAGYRSQSARRCRRATSEAVQAKVGGLGGGQMKFSEILKEAREWLQREGQLTYRSLKREFDLDDEALEDLKFELIGAGALAVGFSRHETRYCPVLWP